MLRSILLLLGRKALSVRNTVVHFTPWQWARNLAFSAAGLGLLFGIYYGFWRLLTYLDSVQVIGPLLVWKLTAMAFLTTFSMVAVSGLLTALSTIYYSQDLRFLMRSPVSVTAVFIDKSLESAFFASWMIGLMVAPYIAALGTINGYGLGFYAAFAAVIVPFLALAASIGIGFTLLVMYCFPSSRTRDVIWVFSTLCLTLVYGLIRYAEPERLIRPDALTAVAEYLRFLQAPTAPYAPSWWVTRALQAHAAGRLGEFWGQAGLLWGAALGAYGLLVALARHLYFDGYSGAQEGPLAKRVLTFKPLAEGLWARRLGLDPAVGPLFWRERTTFFRDVKHWSQIVLVMGLIFVYLFSIRRLPLDSADLRSLVSFLNIGIAGFVLAALGLRFTYPSISLEGRSFWVLGAAPVTWRAVMAQKFAFSAVPMTAVALILGLMTNWILDADAFISGLSIGALVLVTWALCAMGVGFGAIFPMFDVENIHQVESSVGGFVYMAACLAYVGATIVILSWPVHMHFQERFGRVGVWNWQVAALCAGALAALNAVAFILPWTLGRRALERYEA